MFSLLDSLTLTAAFGSFLLAIIVFLKDPKKLLNITFTLFSLSTVFWILTNFLFSYYKIEIVLQSQYAFGSLIMPFALIWIWIFLENIEKRKIISLAIIAITTFVMAYFEFFIAGLSTNPNGETEIIAGPLFNFYSLFTLLIFAYFIYELICGIRKTDNIKKVQLKFILLGSLAFGGISMFTSFLLPLFKIIPVGPYDAQSSLFFVAFSAYAILKHKLFNLKVVATELLIFAIWVFLLVKILLAQSTGEVIINTILLLLLLVFGLLLIRSVIKEVEAREKIELLASDLQKANDRLRELDKQKSEFVSFATHQLRAPLTAMKGYASLILEGDLGKLSHELKSAISRIYDSSNTLANIVDDYLNISRIELGSMKYSFAPLDLKDLIDSVIGELRPNIEKSKLSFDFKVDRNRQFMVSVDKDKFKQIIANLIDNSIKYTPAGFVNVSLEKKPAMAGGKIVFSVKDSGIGIASEVMPQLFAKFSRAENGTRQNIHGTGLGLFVAKEIVTAHKGRIWAESKGEGQGSAFFVELDEVI